MRREKSPHRYIIHILSSKNYIMKCSEYLYDSVKSIWNSYYTHPFVAGIGNGTLDVEKFKFYLIQDYLYLLDYAKVFALGIVKATDEQTMRDFSVMVHDILNGEMKIHKSYMKKLGISAADIKNVTPSLSNTSYTNYMLSVSHCGTLTDLAVAILSCAWSYELIATELSNIENSINHPFYGEWISGYTSNEYKETTKWCIDLVDSLAENASEKELERLREIFITCSKYEYNFWEMSFNMSFN